MLPLQVALAALALTFLAVPTSTFAGDGVGQPAGRFGWAGSAADRPVAPHPPAAPPVSPDGGLRDLSAWWLLPLVAGLAGLGELLVVLDRHHYFDDLD